VTAFRRTNLALEEHALEGHYGSILAVILRIDSVALMWASSLPYLFGSFGHTFTSLISSSLQAIALHVTTGACTKSRNRCCGGTSSDHSERGKMSIAEQTQRSKVGRISKVWCSEAQQSLRLLPNLRQSSRFWRGARGKLSCARFFGRCRALHYPLFLEALLGLPQGRGGGEKSEEGRLEISLSFWRVNVATLRPRDWGERQPERTTRCVLRVIPDPLLTLPSWARLAAV
jgi:hypothetical protein